MRKFSNFTDVSSGFAVAAVLFSITLLTGPSFRVIAGHLRQSVVQSQWSKLITAPQYPGLLILIAAVGIVILCGPRIHQFTVRLVSSVRARTVKIHRLIWLSAFYSCFLFAFGKSFGSAAACLIVGILIHLATCPQGHRAAPRLQDDPIEFEEEDLLHRGSILQTLESHIEAETSVVALVGDFGDGKTSVLRMLEKRLETRSDIVSLPFSSWLPGDSTALAATLLSSMGQRLKTKYIIPDLRRSLRKYARLLAGTVPGLPASVKDLFEDEGQQQQIAKLREQLRSLEVRVVVLLDEVDRMQADELDTLFKIVRGVPEFRHFTFICALNVEALVRSLSRWSGDEFYVYRYIEKFFPNQVELSKIDPNILMSEFDRRFSAFTERYKLLQIPDERREFEEEFNQIWTKHLKRQLTNIRRLTLYFSSLGAIFEGAQGDLNLRDAMILELLKELAPAVYTLIYKYGYHFYYAKWDWATRPETPFAEKQESDAGNEFYTQLLEGVPLGERDLAAGLVAGLFPKFASFWSKRPRPIANPSDAAAKSRIYHPRYFLRYFIHRVPITQMSAAERTELRTKLQESQQVDAAFQVFSFSYGSMTEHGKKLDFIDELQSLLASLTKDQLLGLVEFVCKISIAFDPGDLLGESPKFRRLIFLGAARFPELAQQVFETVIMSSASESFAATVFFYIFYPERNDDYRQNGELNVDALKQAFRDKMRTRYVASGLSIFETPREVALTSLFRWAECGDEGSTQVHAYLKQQFSKEPKYIGRFLNWTMMFGGFGRDEVDKIDKLSSAQYILSLLNFHGEKAYGTDEDREAVEVFLNIFKDGSLDLSQS